MPIITHPPVWIELTEYRPIKRPEIQTPKAEKIPKKVPAKKTAKETTLAHLNTRVTVLSESLCEAAEEGDVPKIKQLLKKIGPNCRDRFNDTPLHRASVCGQNEAVKVLIAAGANIYAEVPGHLHRTPMQDAISFGHFDVIKTLIDAGYDVNYKSPSAYTRSLEDACQTGSDILVNFLLSKGAKIDLCPHLIFRATWHPKILALLIANGANIQAKKSDDDPLDPGAEPLHYAVSIMEKESIRILLQAKANKKAKNAAGKTPLDIFKESMDNMVSTGQIKSKKSFSDYQALEKLLASE